MAGVVESVGADVTRFQPGDEVYGIAEGSFAEYAGAREKKLAAKPSNLSFEESMAIPISAVTALQACATPEGHARGEGADHWRVRGCRYVWRADRQSIWG